MCERRREKLGKERVRIQTAFQAPPVGSRERKATNSYHGSLGGGASKWRAAFSSETTGEKGKEISGMKLLAHGEVEGRDFTAPLFWFLK